MVSKVAVMALVAVIAVPILLGYAFNLTETTESGYKVSGDEINVTPLLQNDTSYSYAHGSLYQNNSDFYSVLEPWPPQVYKFDSMPEFKTITTAKTSIKGNIATASGSNLLGGSGNVSNYSPLLYYQADYDPSLGYVTMNFITRLNGVDTSVSVAKFHSANYDYDTSKWTVTYYTNSDEFASTTYDNFYKVSSFSKTSGYTGFMYVLYCESGQPQYYDIAGGYQFHGRYSRVVLPDNTKSVLFTVNLGSITDSDYGFVISAAGFNYRLMKTTTDGIASWKLYDAHGSSPVFVTDLYYDPDRSDNTYQILFDIKDNGNNDYDLKIELRYVGGWPTLIGEANSYITYTDTRTAHYGADLVMDNLGIINSDPGGIFTPYTQTGNGNTVSPIIRVDDTYFRAFEYQVISGQTYTPASFKTNPSTTISDINIYGTSLTFGGQTFTVSKGKITLEGRSIPVDGLKFNSVPNGSGTYDNMIGNTLISTSAAPSTISFNGKWSASISTASMESFTYTKTEWHAGSFGWNGIDQNFLMVGLLTSIGVFIALGIYIRRTKANLWPLLIVCGGAAMLFFVML